jgi:hypothetical protein
MKNHTFSNTKKRIIAIALIIAIIVLTTMVLLFTYICFRYKAEVEGALDSEKTVVFDEIYQYMEDLYTDSEISSSKVAKNIESTIKNEYTSEEELKELREQFRKNNYDSIIDIIESNTEGVYLNGVNNQRNSVMVATNDKILYSNDYLTSSSIKKDRYQSWNSFISNNYNESLAKSAYQGLVRASTDILLIEPYESDISGHKYYETLYRDKLLEVYKNEGLEGLKNYEMLVPSYIKNTNTDIFGNNEITAGVHRDSYRIMVIQKCNVYDQILANKESLDTDRIDKLSDQYNSTLNMLYIVEIFVILGFTIAIIDTCVLFNIYVIDEHKCTRKE